MFIFLGRRRCESTPTHPKGSECGHDLLHGSSRRFLRGLLRFPSMDFRLDSCTNFSSFGHKSGRVFLRELLQGLYLNSLGAFPSHICVNKIHGKSLQKFMQKSTAVIPSGKTNIHAGNHASQMMNKYIQSPRINLCKVP